MHNPKFFDWLLDEEFIMAFTALRKKDEKRHLEKIDEVGAKQQKATEALEKKFASAWACKSLSLVSRASALLVAVLSFLL